MSEQPIKPPGLEHLDNSDSVAPKDRVDPDILVKDAEAVAKIFNNKIQNLNPADGLFFMQQVAQNLILAPKKEENFNEKITVSVQQNNLPERTDTAITHEFMPENLINTILTTTTFEKDELLNDQQKDNFSNEIHIPTKSDNQKSNNTTTKNGDKQNPAKAPTAHNNRQRKTINVNRINAWISGGNKQSPREVQKEEAKNEISSDDVIQSQVDNVVNHSSDWLKSSSQKQKDKKTLNVLILGETGVGKSTWINAFANYLIYNTLEEAITAETPICVIPTKFTLFDKNNQCHEIVLGNHENECFENEGQSATQDAKTYFFETENYNVYLIDTPGMNDTRGYEQDEKNMQKILQAISPFKELHAICFLFKPNETRLKNCFEYTINTLLNNLHKTSLNNACFVFTNTQTTFFKPGETLGLLETFFDKLNKKEDIAVPLNDDNVFCLENGAFRFCCAYFSRVLFDETEIEIYSKSWKHSSQEIERFLDYASKLCPHNTAETLSIYETRTWIMHLIDPIITICDIIETNKQKLEERLEELDSKKHNMKELQQRKFVQTVSLEIKQLETPQIVCTNEKCVRFENIMGNMEPIFETVCHKNCFIKSVRSCLAFGDGGKCRNCGCSYTEHMRIFYEQHIAVNDSEIEFQQNQKNCEKIKKKMIENAKAMIEKYKDEYDFVMNVMAKFSLFLSQNGIAQRFDIFENHMEDLEEKENKLLETIENYDDQKYYRLGEYLMHYIEIRDKLFEENLHLSLAEIQDFRQKLFAMPLTGPKIAEIFDIFVNADENDHQENITRCDRDAVIGQSKSWYQSLKHLFPFSR